MPNPRSFVGKLLLKTKKKPVEISAPTLDTSAPVPSTPVTDPKAEGKIETARQKVQGQLDQLGQRINGLRYGALKIPLDRVATTLRGQMATLDTLPDPGAKATRLMQVGEACGKLALELTQAADKDGKLWLVQQAVDKAVGEVDNALIAITVDKARDPLLERLEVIKQQRDDMAGAVDVAELGKLGTLTPLLTQLNTDVAETKKRMDEAATAKKDWADDLLVALQNKVKGAPESAKKAIADEVKALKAQVKKTNEEFGEGEFGKVVGSATDAYWLYDSANKRLTKLINLDALKTSHESAKKQQGLLAKHTDFQTAFKLMKQRLDAAILEADPFLTSGEGVDADDLDAMVLKMGGAERSARNSLAEYDNYKKERKAVEKLVEELKKHKQATAIASEIKQVEDAIGEAHGLGAQAEGGWHRAKIALKPLTAQCAKIKTLADKLESAAEKLPALTKGLEGKGVKKEDLPKLLNMAHKLLVEENCSPEDAVDMAQSAGKFTDQGLEEPDALVSSRLKHSLMKGDGALDEAHAHAVGRNVRCRGTATMEDVKCVAQGMKRMSAKVLDELNKAGVTTGICQGPVTDMIPELVDVNPRGWGSKTWDEVPGVYMGDKGMVVVGTMDDNGKRKVPGPGEGPVQHGTPDLLGHEAGHAYDVSGGGDRRNHPDFVAARAKDLAETTDVKLLPGRDDYFMTKTESGTGRQADDDGARSETFAESFALHFANNTSKWPNLKKFWESNPWGA